MVRKFLFACLALILVLAAAALYAVNDRPSLDDYQSSMAARWTGAAGVTATFLGVSTLLISDGETHLMTDGFFSRPGLWQVLTSEIESDSDRISEGLAAANVHDLDALIVLHSHYDHAMDAPEVAERTDAVLIGSESTANIARGWGMAPARMVVPQPGLPLSFGRFTVTLIESRHLPHGMAEGEIEEPLVPPLRALDYREGTTYIVHIDHPAGSLVVVGSAGWVDGALDGYSSDVLLLGVGGLSAMTPEYRRTFYDETLGRLRPHRVMPIHYDDFTRPLSEPLWLMPRRVDDFDQTMGELRQRAAANGFALELLPLAEPVLLLPQ